MPRQTNCEDCGLFTLDTLLSLRASRVVIKTIAKMTILNRKRHLWAMQSLFCVAAQVAASRRGYLVRDFPCDEKHSSNDGQFSEDKDDCPQNHKQRNKAVGVALEENMVLLATSQ